MSSAFNCGKRPEIWSHGAGRFEIKSCPDESGADAASQAMRLMTEQTTTVQKKKCLQRRAGALQEAHITTLHSSARGLGPPHLMQLQLSIDQSIMGSTLSYLVIAKGETSPPTPIILYCRSNNGLPLPHLQYLPPRQTKRPTY